MGSLVGPKKVGVGGRHPNSLIRRWNTTPPRTMPIHIREQNRRCAEYCLEHRSRYGLDGNILRPKRIAGKSKPPDTL